ASRARWWGGLALPRSFSFFRICAAKPRVVVGGAYRSQPRLSAVLIPSRTVSVRLVVIRPKQLQSCSVGQRSYRGNGSRRFERKPPQTTNPTAVHRILNPTEWPSGAAPAAKSRRFRWLVRRSSGSHG